MQTSMPTSFWMMYCGREMWSIGSAGSLTSFSKIDSISSFHEGNSEGKRRTHDITSRTDDVTDSSLALD